MSTPKQRIGIIGCGNTSNFFLKGWQAWQDEVEIAALCDVVPQQIEDKQQKYPELCRSAAIFTDYRDMLAEVPLDIVCVCSPSEQHLEQGEAALAAGRHLFIEKPTGYNLEEARRFQYLARKYSHLKVAVAYSLRYHKAFIALRELIASGGLGDILSGEVSYSHPSFGAKHGRSIEAGDDHVKDAATSRDEASSPQPKRPFDAPEGAYISSSQLTSATHPWDLARYFFGEVSECFSTSGRRTGVQMGILWMESGTLCHVLAGAMRVPDVGGNQHQFVQAHGTKGSAWLMRDLYEPYEFHAYYRTEGEIQEMPLPSDIPDSSHGVIIRSRNLLDAIAGQAELICSLEDSVRTTELLHALWLSERTQVKVPVLPANSTG